MDNRIVEHKLLWNMIRYIIRSHLDCVTLSSNNETIVETASIPQKLYPLDLFQYIKSRFLQSLELSTET